MQTFTGWQYLLIDCANQFGLDKKLFEERIQWATDHLDQLEALAEKADNQPLYLKAVQAIRKAQKGVPTGHLVGFDATCSGIQVMSALTGCKAGAEATGLVNPNKRADAYTECTKIMNEILGGLGVTVSRSEAKQALMTSFYGSKAEPVKLFGEGSAELEAFYAAATTLAPGAWQLLQDLLASWRPYAMSHQWQLPDGYEAKVKVMQKVETRIEVDELDHATFGYEYYVNQGTSKGLANAANVVHSVDAYVLRCIHRRCNYDADMVNEKAELMREELHERHLGDTPEKVSDPAMAYYLDLYERSGMADVVSLPYINRSSLRSLPTVYIQELLKIVDSMLVHSPFEVVTVHDEFKCHANHMNYLRQHYINIFAEMADAHILDMILSDIFNTSVSYDKLSNNLSEYIAQSNYALT